MSSQADVFNKLHSAGEDVSVSFTYQDVRHLDENLEISVWQRERGDTLRDKNEAHLEYTTYTTPNDCTTTTHNATPWLTVWSKLYVLCK